MPSRIKLLSYIIWLTTISFSSSALAQAPTTAIDSAAIQSLQRMTDYISTVEQFSVHTDSTLEDLLDTGQRIDLDVAADVTVRRPDKIHARRTGELVNQVFVYDGKSLSLYQPSAGVYATKEAPATIEAVLDYTREELGLMIPISDLVYHNVFAILTQNLSSAVVLGKTTINGTVCHHLAFRRPDVDFQVWIADGDRPWPCKYVVTDTSTPELISTVTVLSDWNDDPVVPADTFSFVPPKGAQAIEFLPIDSAGDFGR